MNGRICGALDLWYSLAAINTDSDCKALHPYYTLGLQLFACTCTKETYRTMHVMYM
jgi:hypothetical protein